MFIHSFILKGFIEPQLFAEPAGQEYKNDKTCGPSTSVAHRMLRDPLHLDKGRRDRQRPRSLCWVWEDQAEEGQAVLPAQGS